MFGSGSKSSSVTGSGSVVMDYVSGSTKVNVTVPDSFGSGSTTLFDRTEHVTFKPNSYCTT
jgi:hypothetical protein